MMCSRFLKNQHEVKHGRLYMLAESFFDGLLACYRVSLQWVMRHQALTMLVLLLTIMVSA